LGASRTGGDELFSKFRGRRQKQERIMSKKIILLAGVVLTAAAAFAPAAQAGSHSRNSLVVVDGDRGRVVYDDGMDDGACVYRRKFVGYDYYGDPIFRKVMRCF
jgi:hypothetical protein